MILWLCLDSKSALCTIGGGQVDCERGFALIPNLLFPQSGPRLGHLGTGFALIPNLLFAQSAPAALAASISFALIPNLLFAQ